MVLTAASAVPEGPPVRLLRCSSCGAGFVHAPQLLDYREIDRIGAGMAVDYYVEQGAGIDAMASLLLRLGGGDGRRLLEVGCAYGFALDFARSALGWRVQGVDPSPLAAEGAEALGVPIARAALDASTRLAFDAFDGVLASEILEHVEGPVALLAAIRARLAPGGVLALTTPDFAAVRPSTPAGTLGRVLSPGFHLVLYDARALRAVLRRAGFAAVRVEESGHGLVAFAAASEAALAGVAAAAPPPDRAPLCDYFAARAAAAPAGSALASGFAYRHFKECVNAGLYEAAWASRGRLARVLGERFGLDLDAIEPASAATLAAPGGTASGAVPYNLTGALFFSGILRLNTGDANGRAADDFASAAAFAAALLARQSRVGLCDGETEDLWWQSRRHVPLALAELDPDRALAALAALPPAAPVEGATRDIAATRRATFVRLVNAGAYGQAERLAASVDADTPALSTDAVPRERLDTLFCLAMLALRRGRPAEAAERFALVEELSESSGGSADLGEAARRHLALALAERVDVS